MRHRFPRQTRPVPDAVEQHRALPLLGWCSLNACTAHQDVRHFGIKHIPMLGLFLLLQLFPAIVEGQSWTVTSDSITRREFLDILVVGERTDLSETGPAVAADKQVLISLYGVAREGSCVPETHYVCAFDYYLAVSDFGEYPRQGAFRIGRWGEIRAIQWLPRQTNDAYGTARLRLQVANYPKIVLQVTDRLQEEIRTIELLASPTGIVSLRNPP